MPGEEGQGYEIAQRQSQEVERRVGNNAIWIQRGEKYIWTQVQSGERMTKKGRKKGNKQGVRETLRK